MTAFNAAQIVHSTVEGENFSTEYSPAPEGRFLAKTEEVDADSVKWVEKLGRSVLELVWRINDPSAPEESQRKAARQAIWLDLTATGDLDKGKEKNVALGQTRVAVGQADTDPWSMTMLGEQTAYVTIKHDPYTRKDGKPGVRAIVTNVEAM